MRMVAILRLLNEQGALSIAFLSRRLNVSATTLRRDLADLESQGVLSRTHGGAKALIGTAELPVDLRSTQSQAAKRAIAQRAAQLLPQGHRLAVAINGGSTAGEVAQQLAPRHDVTIVTNSLTTAMGIGGRPGSQVIMTGGVVRSPSFELVGTLAENTCNAINVNVAILGADGVSAVGGATTHDDAEARTNRAMALHSQRLIIVADGSKIGRLTWAKVVDAERISDLVTDSTADMAELSQLAAAGVRIHCVDVGAPSADER